MKKLIAIVFCAAAISFSGNIYAQQKKGVAKVTHEIKKDAKAVGHEVKKAADTVGDKTAEVAAKGLAKVKDKTYQGKMGPKGETIYIDKDSKYYFVNKEGHKVYVAKTHLKDRPVKK